MTTSGIDFVLFLLMHSTFLHVAFECTCVALVAIVFPSHVLTASRLYSLTLNLTLLCLAFVAS